MNSLEADDLKIDLIADGSRVSLIWSGKSLMSNPSIVLDPYFLEIVRELKGKKTTMDFTKLLIMNSSTVPPILTLIRNMEEAHNTFEIIYDESVFWQRTSFRLLRITTMGFKFVTITKITGTGEG
jgi:hypothetical protein